MLARMTPTSEAPGRRRQVVCSREGPRPCANSTQGYEAAVIGNVIAITVFAFTDRLRRPHRITCPAGGQLIGTSNPPHWYRLMARPIIAHSNRQKRNARKGGIHHGHGS